MAGRAKASADVRGGTHATDWAGEPVGAHLAAEAGRAAADQKSAARAQGTPRRGLRGQGLTYRERFSVGGEEERRGLTRKTLPGETTTREKHTRRWQGGGMSSARAQSRAKAPARLLLCSGEEEERQG